MQDKSAANLKKVASDLCLLVEQMMDYTVRGKVSASIKGPKDVELVLKVFNNVSSWYDKTVNQPGNLAGLVDSLNDENKKYLIDLKTLEETEPSKFT